MVGAAGRADNTGMSDHDDDLIRWLRAKRPELLDAMARADYVPDWQKERGPDASDPLVRSGVVCSDPGGF